VRYFGPVARLPPPGQELAETVALAMDASALQALHERHVSGSAAPRREANRCPGEEIAFLDGVENSTGWERKSTAIFPTGAIRSGTQQLANTVRRNWSASIGVQTRGEPGFCQAFPPAGIKRPVLNACYPRKWWFLGA
jgi:hypothetical protein